MLHNVSFEQFRPSLLFACSCGNEMKDCIETKSLVCRCCSHTVSHNDRQAMELASRTFLEEALIHDVETVLFGRSEYEIDEASMPTGLFPIILARAAQTSTFIQPDKEYLFQIGEIDNPDGLLTTTHFYIEVNPKSTMNIKEALVILTHVTKRLIELSRLDDPSNPVINDLRTMSMTELADGFTGGPQPKAVYECERS